MIVSIQISTGRVIEMQSHARPGTLIANAVVAGFNANDIEEREVTYEEYLALVPPPVPVDQSNIDLIDKKIKALALLMRTYINQTRAGNTTNVTMNTLKADFKTAFDSLT